MQEATVTADPINESPVVEQAIPVVQAPVIEQKAPEVVQPIVVAKAINMPGATEIDKFIAKIEADGSEAERTILHGLQTYLKVMAPGQILEDRIGAGAQLTLFNHFRNVLERGDGENFKAQWKLILNFFHLHEQVESALGDRYINRFGYAWTQDGGLWTAFVSLIHFIKMTANPATRAAALKQVSLKKVLETGFNDEASRRITSFYS